MTPTLTTRWLVNLWPIPRRGPRCPGTTGTPNPSPSRFTPRRSSPVSRQSPSSKPISRTTPYHRPTCCAESTSNHQPTTMAPHPTRCGADVRNGYIKMAIRGRARREIGRVEATGAPSEITPEVAQIFNYLSTSLRKPRKVP